MAGETTGDRCWILVGMMGSGKSSVGQDLAERSKRQFVDTDQLVQEHAGVSVADIFELFGEEGFRDQETSALRRLQPSRKVIATGGGIVLREENWTEMRRLGPTVFLDVPWERLAIRLRKTRNRRPLLSADNWQERLRDLCEARRPLYMKADLVVRIDGQSVSEAARLVHRQLETFGKLQVP